MTNLHTKEKLLHDLKKIGVEKGDLLHLKISMRAIGRIEGGANTLLNALLEAVGESGTIISDAFVKAFPIPMSETNKEKISDDETPSYAGVFANEMIKHPKNIRSKHPIHKFAAIGKQAEEFCNNHTEKSGAYDLLEEMAKQDAKNLTIGGDVIGVGTTHIAIEKCKYDRKVKNMGRYFINSKGEKELAKIDWKGACGAGIRKFLPLYENGALINRGKIGNADSILTSMKKTLEVEMKKITEDPYFFFCDDPGCHICRISWEHSDKKYLKYYLKTLIDLPKKASLKRFIKKIKNRKK